MLLRRFDSFFNSTLKRGIWVLKLQTPISTYNFTMNHGLQNRQRRQCWMRCFLKLDPSRKRQTRAPMWVFVWGFDGFRWSKLTVVIWNCWDFCFTKYKAPGTSGCFDTWYQRFSFDVCNMEIVPISICDTVLQMSLKNWDDHYAEADCLSGQRVSGPHAVATSIFWGCYNRLSWWLRAFQKNIEKQSKASDRNMIWTKSHSI